MSILEELQDYSDSFKIVVFSLIYYDVSFYWEVSIKDWAAPIILSGMAELSTYESSNFWFSALDFAVFCLLFIMKFKKFGSECESTFLTHSASIYLFSDSFAIISGEFYARKLSIVSNKKSFSPFFVSFLASSRSHSLLMVLNFSSKNCTLSYNCWFFYTISLPMFLRFKRLFYAAILFFSFLSSCLFVYLLIYTDCFLFALPFSLFIILECFSWEILES